jgi:hypothetical protein
MLNIDFILINLVVLTFVAFTLLIVVSLKLRQRLQQKALMLTASQIWQGVSKKASEMNLPHSQLIFTIFQDSSPTEITLVAKDANDEVIGTIKKPMLGRKRYLTIAEENFIIEFPATWNRSAILYSARDYNQIIARYKQSGWMGRHTYEIAGLGRMRSIRSKFNLKGSWEYIMDSKKIGIKQSISSTFAIGNMALLPQELPLAVRLFILSV